MLKKILLIALACATVLLSPTPSTAQCPWDGSDTFDIVIDGIGPYKPTYANITILNTTNGPLTVNKYQGPLGAPGAAGCGFAVRYGLPAETSCSLTAPLGFLETVTFQVNLQGSGTLPMFIELGVGGVPNGPPPVAWIEYQLMTNDGGGDSGTHPYYFHPTTRLELTRTSCR
jgi:hypothetical protein